MGLSATILPPAASHAGFTRAVHSLAYSWSAPAMARFLPKRFIVYATNGFTYAEKSGGMRIVCLLPIAVIFGTLVYDSSSAFRRSLLVWIAKPPPECGLFSLGVFVSCSWCWLLFVVSLGLFLS